MISTLCLICNAPVPVYDFQHSPKICDKCKAAVLKIRDEIEKGKNDGQINTES